MKTEEEKVRHIYSISTPVLLFLLSLAELITKKDIGASVVLWICYGLYKIFSIDDE